MALISYGQIKQTLESKGGLQLPPEGSVDPSVAASAVSGQLQVEIPQIPKIDFPLEDLTYGNNLRGTKQDVNKLLSLKDGKGSKQNNFAGSQVIINSDRLIFNSRVDYLMLFGQTGVAIASPGNVNIDADESVTLYGEEGVFLGIPGKGAVKGNINPPTSKAEPTTDNDYEPLALGNKLANLIEDLLIVIKNATILTPVGNGYLREDTQYDLACLQARIPEILSTYAYVDGISHEPTDPAPTPPTTITVAVPTTLQVNVTGGSLQGLNAGGGGQGGGVGTAQPVGQNGNLSDDQLVSFQAPYGEPDGPLTTFKLAKEAGTAWIRLMAAAKADGVTPALTGGYRTYQRQHDIFDWDLYVSTGGSLTDTTPKKGAVRAKKNTNGKTAAAFPGTSNHGWGNAVDAAGTEFKKWLKKRGWEFGWSWYEGKQVGEDWHFTYTTEPELLKAYA